MPPLLNRDMGILFDHIMALKGHLLRMGLNADVAIEADQGSLDILKRDAYPLDFRFQAKPDGRYTIGAADIRLKKVTKGN